MRAGVSITRGDLTASELRKAASGEKDGAAARRILALALVLDGVDRKTAAETCGMDRQTLRDWVHRYNAAGLAGLRNLKSPGPGSKLTAAVQSLQRHYQSGRDHRAGAGCAISSATCRPSLASILPSALYVACASRSVREFRRPALQQSGNALTHTRTNS